MALSVEAATAAVAGVSDPELQRSLVDAGMLGDVQVDADKVSLLFSVKNRPGMLFKSLKPLSDRGIDLCKIESRPMRGRSWEYLFFLDFRGRLGDKRVADAMAEMTRQCVWLKVLGAYAAARAS